MNIATSKQVKKPNWFYNRNRKPGVIGASPADNLRDTVSLAGSVALTSGAAAAVISSMGTGALASTALAVPAAVAGGLIGAFASPLLQSGLGTVIGAKPGNDDGMGAIAGGAVASGLAAGAGAIAAGFGADPTIVALTAAGVGAGFLTIAGLADR